MTGVVFGSAGTTPVCITGSTGRTGLRRFLPAVSSGPEPRTVGVR